MFFVGATGQLLTLILTVCLPFVFLLSGQPKNELLQEKALFDIQNNHQEITSTTINSLELSVYFDENIENINFKVDDSYVKKLPPKSYRIKWKSFYTESSGNKAPPAFHCFSC
jgi:hypothetical protein